jgi:beta-lactamase class A
MGSRYLVVGLLALNVLLGFMLIREMHSIDDHLSSEYPLIDPARNFTPQEDFIVNIQPLREEVMRIVGAKGEKISLYFEVLNTGANISINPAIGIFPASLAKLPLAMVVAKKVESGKWDWDNQLVLLDQDRDRSSGELYKRQVGTALTIEELLKELLVNSDNTAYAILLRNMESDDLGSIVSAVGLDELFMEGGKISAKEYSRLFRSLYTSSYLKRENSQKILDCLTATPFDEYLRSGLPEEVVFAHKIGENHYYNSYSDSGIVYLKNRPYMLSVMVETVDSPDEKQRVVNFMNEVSKTIYEYVSTQ